MDKQNQIKRYPYLELLTTQQLQEILRMDCHGTEEFEPKLIWQVLDILNSREAAADHETDSTSADAWNDFQKYYNTPDGQGQSLYGKRTEPTHNLSKKSRMTRRIALIAASIAVFFAMMITVQAAGVDVLGTIARWTDNTFHFEATRHSPSVMADSEVVQPLQNALEERGIPAQLAPLWIPVGFEPGQVEIVDQQTSLSVSCTFADSADRRITVCVSQYYADAALSDMQYEKDDGAVEAYASNGRMFYVFSNQSDWTGVWSNGQYSISISGSLTQTELLQMLDSIREMATE